VAISVVGVGAATSGIGAVSPAYPAGYTAVADDVAAIWCECENTDTITAPASWATIIDSVVSTGTPTKLTVMWSRLTAGQAAPTIADAGNHNVAQMIVLSGCITTGNPWDVFLNTTELVADTTVSCPAITTTAANCLVMAAFSTGQDVASTAGATGWANAALTGVTERMDVWTASGTGGGFSMMTGVKPAAGSVGNCTATLSLVANFKALITIAFKEQVAAPGGGWRGLPSGSRRPAAVSNAANW
jgi:hypothetical protein